MSCFLKVLSGKVSKRKPVWLMRQAGRYLPEYRAIRKDVPDFLSLVYNPDLASEVTLQPMRRFDLDAAILFSDILVIPDALGQYVRFVKGEGPRLSPINYPQEVMQLTFDGEKLLPIMETIQKTRAALKEDKALIGFAGSPWTVACYMVDGRGKTNFPKARAMAQDNPELFQKIMDKVVDATVRYLFMQVEAGVNALQLFDSWAGLLDTSQFDQWVIQPTQKIVHKIREQYPQIPIIGFARDSQNYLLTYAEKTGVNALGLSQELPLDWIQNTLPKHIPIQGNLDPNLLIQGGEGMKKAVRDICHAFQDRPHIFNLGHGINKETPYDHVTELIATIRECQ